MSAPDYQTMSSTVTLNAGQTVIFSPMLQPVLQAEVSISGTVTDSSNQPLQNAIVSVSIDDAVVVTTSTNVDGTYEITGLSDGTLDIDVSKEGYQPQSTRFIVTGSNQLNFSPTMSLLPDTATVSGRVIDITTQSPVVNSIVTLLPSGQFVEIVNANGEFTISDVPVGDTRVLVSAQGYKTNESSYLLVAGESLSIDIGLSQLDDTSSIIQISGEVLAQDTEQPLAGALISIERNGTLLASTEANATGQYQIILQDEGQFTVIVSYDGYESISTQQSPSLGSQVTFSPRLSPLPDSELTFKLINLNTDGLLPNAAVSLQYTGDTSSSLVGNTNNEGVFLLGGLQSGSAILTIELDGYTTFSDFVSLQQGALTDVGLIGLEPNIADFPATITGVVLDSRTNAPIANASVLLDASTGLSLSTTSDSQGQFRLENITESLATLSVSYEEYVGVQFSIVFDPASDENIGQVRLRPVDADNALPELSIDNISQLGVITDTQSLSVSGNIAFDLSNVGNTEVTAPISLLAFYDRNRDQAYSDVEDVLIGQTEYTSTLSVNQSAAIQIPIVGTALYRDEEISIFIDSGEAIVEISELDNVVSSVAQCRIETVPVANSNPQVKWQWKGAINEPSAVNVYGPVLVVQLTDDNTDGVIDENDNPDVVFVSFARGPERATINAIDGETGQEIWAVMGEEIMFWGSPAAGDIDNDGLVEIIVLDEDRTGLLAFEHDGTLKWKQPISDQTQDSRRDGLALADLDGDGNPEIIHGKSVYTSQGNLLWQGEANFYGDNGIYGYLSIVADIDLDGSPEVIAGPSAYNADGSLKWIFDESGAGFRGDGYTGVGNFNDNDEAEIVLVSRSRVFLISHEGDLIWNIALPGGGEGGPPTISDLDGDGEPEIGVAGRRNYTVIETDGSVKWTSTTEDASSNRTGSSVFDFENDGKVEILYADEKVLRIYSGEDGEVLFSTPNDSGTILEYPVVADIDNDGHAEFLVGSDVSFFGGTTEGLRAFESQNDVWPATRKIWNQHSYHINNVNEDGTIPRNEEPSWLSHNTYRLNALIGIEPLSQSDLTVSNINVIDKGLGTQPDVIFTVGNAGLADLSEGSIATLQSEAGAILAQVNLPELVSGNFTSILFESVDGIVSNAVLTVIVDADNQVTECNELNNQASALASSNVGDVSLSLSNNFFAPMADVVIDRTVHNVGVLTNSYLVELSILDINGDIVEALPQRTITNIASDSTVAFQDVWNVGLTVAGEYTATTVLTSLDGTEIDRFSANFTIREGGIEGALAATIRTAPRQLEYHTTDTVNIENLIRNTTQSTYLLNTTYTLDVISPDNANVFSQQVAIDSLAPNQFREAFSSFDLSDAIIGQYRLEGTLRNDTGVLLAQGTSNFEVINDVRQSLLGQVTLAQSLIVQGETQTCDYSLNNIGVEDVANVRVQGKLGLVSNEQIIQVASEQIINASRGINSLTSYTFSTSSLDLGDYACLLDIYVNDELISRAVDEFTIRESGELLVNPTVLALPEGNASSVTVVLSASPISDNVIVNLSTNNQEVTLSDVQISFNQQNWNQPQVVNVLSVEDQIDRDDTSQITVQVDTSASDRVFAQTADHIVDVSIIDNDLANIIVSTNALTIDENNGTATFTVVLTSEPVLPVVLSIESADTQEVTVDQMITFDSTSWNQAQTVIVTAIDDQIDRNDSTNITIGVDASNQDAAYSNMANQNIAVTITDDDQASVQVDPVALTIGENGGTGQFTIKLDTQPIDQVVMDITSTDTAEAVADNTQITFTEANWQIGETITVTGVDDQEITTDQTSIDITVSTGADYLGIVIPDVSVQLVNDDIISVTGAVTAQLAEITPNESQVCDFTITNNGNVDQPTLLIWKSIVDADGNFIATTSETIDLAAANSRNIAEAFTVNNSPVGTYRCLLEAEVQTQRQILAESSFNIIVPNTQLEADLSLPNAGRVLVLMDEGQQTCTAVQSFTIKADFHKTLGDWAKVYAKAFDKHELLDYEVSKPAHFNGEVNINGYYSDLDVSIVALDTESVTMRVSSRDTIQGDYKFYAKYEYKRKLYHRNTGTTHFKCGKPLQVGQQLGHFTVLDVETVEKVVEDRCDKSSHHYYKHGSKKKHDDECKYDKYHGHKKGKHGKDKKDKDHEPETPSIEQQQAWLSALLTRANISHTIVDSADEFKRELRTGLYNQYLITAEKEDVSKHLARELREAVHRGEGLVMATGIQMEPDALFDTLGLEAPNWQWGWKKGWHQTSEYTWAHGYQKVWTYGWYYRTHWRHSKNYRTYSKGTGINVIASEISDATQANFALNRRIPDVETNGAQVVGQLIDPQPAFTYSGDLPEKDYPVLSIHQYGDGHGVYFGFDVLAEATEQQNNANGQTYENLLLGSLGYAVPDTINTREGAAVPVMLDIRNLGNAAQVQAEITQSAGAEVVDAGKATETDNGLTWMTNLIQQQSDALTFWTIPQYEQGQASVFAAISTEEGDVLDPLRQDIFATVNESESITAICDDITAQHDADKFSWHALNKLHRAEYYFSKGKGDQGIEELLSAADALRQSQSAAAPAIRKDVDWLIWRLNQELSQTPPAQSGGSHHGHRNQHGNGHRNSNGRGHRYD